MKISKLTPRNPEFKKSVTENINAQPIMQTLGAKIAKIAAGEVHIAVSRSAHICQQNGYLHAGVISTIADSACGGAALSLAAAGSDVLAVEFKINFLAPAAAEKIIAKAKVLRSGKTLCVNYCEVFGVEKRQETLVATMLNTIFIRENKK